jgi:hypothetical protein
MGLVVGFVIAALLAVGIGVGRTLSRMRAESSLTSANVGPKDDAPPGDTERITYTLGSSKVPGCIPAGERFFVSVITAWRDKTSQNTLQIHWETPTTGGDEVTVHVMGQPKAATVAPEGALPTLQLTLPIEPQPVTLSIETLIFEGVNPAGEACFRFRQPPGVPQYAPPITPGHA